MPSLSQIMRGRTPAARARRKARQERWRRPIETARDRREAWASLMFADHGFLRLAYRNRHRVNAAIWRSAQPAPGDIAWAKRAGVRTILSLRGDGFGGDLLEQEAARREGLDFVRLVLLSRSAPPKATLREAIRLLPTLKTPLLMHCKSGADRAGLGAALYLIIVEGRPAAEAKRQLSLRYGHIAQAKTGVLDAFLEAYEITGERAGIPFAEWVETVYDPDALTASFKSNRAADVLIDAMDRE
ncbi:sulfur transferase domain-containing protein [Acuticoccus sp. M5D2P5]|uniref:fused DSP-PTPase phosphatase/NAD kinase-like protein n=1 Tax=Acuticoccus kalidii TaxID=2910977 RepID=UPI001F1683E0|nr:sulfur transferase domain-containing protein [Acuticoccus kalidii]MCF3933805.1 sulfur transferase domain-containing protein [Acuticoccus kalidii]